MKPNRIAKKFRKTKRNGEGPILFGTAIALRRLVLARTGIRRKVAAVFTDIKQTIALVDGTLISALPKIMEASWRKANVGSGMVTWRLHTHFEIQRGIPTRIDITPIENRSITINRHRLTPTASFIPEKQTGAAGVPNNIGCVPFALSQQVSKTADDNDVVMYKNYPRPL